MEEHESEELFTENLSEIESVSEITKKYAHELRISYDDMLQKITNDDSEKDLEPEVGTKQMWDTEKCDWVPFDLWGAHFIVNDRKENLVLRVCRANKFCSSLKGWQNMDGSYLTEQLKEDKEPKSDHWKSFSGIRAFCELMQSNEDYYKMIKQERREYQCEGYWSK